MPSKLLGLFSLLVLVAPGADRGVMDVSRSPRAIVKTVNVQDVRWTRGFWADRFDLVRRVTLPSMWKVMQEPMNSANFRNLRIAAGLEKGEFTGNTWSDGDVYKWIETAAYVFAMTGDQELDRTMDGAILVIAKAQAPDGYINTQTQLTGKKRWTIPRDHELYNLGHLMTAACIHHRMTGKNNFLQVARKAADYLYPVFSERKPELALITYNPTQIMGLVELYRVTRERKYLELAQTFVDIHGSVPGGTDHNQTRVPVREETEAVGHSVLGGYLWAGVTDVYTETGEQALGETVKRLWDDISTRKMYVNGGVAAINRGASFRRDPVWEAYGLEYQLPNMLAYNETCANIAHAMFSWRLALLTRDPRYIDVMESILYNSVLSAWGLDGKSYFYTNPLRKNGKEDRLLANVTHERWPNTWTPGAPRCFCCPPNLARTFASLNGWAYGLSDGTVWVNLYGSNTLETKLPDGTPVSLAQDTEYPWQGLIKFTFQETGAKEISLKLRIPGWSESPSIRINGTLTGIALKPQSYAEIRRVWAKGDTVELDLGMQPRLMEAHPRVEEARNHVAVMRGPVLYCLESHDLPAGVRVDEVAIPAGIKLSARHDPKLLGGVTVIEAEARLARGGDWPAGMLYRPFRSTPSEPLNLRLIPYYAWNNRGVPYMTVWLPVSR